MWSIEDEMPAVSADCVDIWQDAGDIDSLRKAPKAVLPRHYIPWKNWEAWWGAADGDLRKLLIADAAGAPDSSDDEGPVPPVRRRTRVMESDDDEDDDEVIDLRFVDDEKKSFGILSKEDADELFGTDSEDEQQESQDFLGTWKGHNMIKMRRLPPTFGPDATIRHQFFLVRVGQECNDDSLLSGAALFGAYRLIATDPGIILRRDEILRTTVMEELERARRSAEDNEMFLFTLSPDSLRNMVTAHSQLTTKSLWTGASISVKRENIPFDAARALDVYIDIRNGRMTGDQFRRPGFRRPVRETIELVGYWKGRIREMLVEEGGDHLMAHLWGINIGSGRDAVRAEPHYYFQIPPPMGPARAQYYVPTRPPNRRVWQTFVSFTNSGSAFEFIPVPQLSEERMSSGLLAITTKMAVDSFRRLLTQMEKMALKMDKDDTSIPTEFKNYLVRVEGLLVKKELDKYRTRVSPAETIRIQEEAATRGSLLPNTPLSVRRLDDLARAVLPDESDITAAEAVAEITEFSEHTKHAARRTYAQADAQIQAIIGSDLKKAPRIHDGRLRAPLAHHGNILNRAIHAHYRDNLITEDTKTRGGCVSSHHTALGLVMVAPTYFDRHGTPGPTGDGTGWYVASCELHQDPHTQDPHTSDFLDNQYVEALDIRDAVGLKEAIVHLMSVCGVDDVNEDEEHWGVGQEVRAFIKDKWRRATIEEIIPSDMGVSYGVRRLSRTGETKGRLKNPARGDVQKALPHSRKIMISVTMWANCAQKGKRGHAIQLVIDRYSREVCLEDPSRPQRGATHLERFWAKRIQSVIVFFHLYIQDWLHTDRKGNRRPDPYVFIGFCKTERMGFNHGGTCRYIDQMGLIDRENRRSAKHYMQQLVQVLKAWTNLYFVASYNTTEGPDLTDSMFPDAGGRAAGAAKKKARTDTKKKGA